MLNILLQTPNPNEPVEIIFVLGKPPREWSNPGGQARFTEQLRTSKTRVVFYDQLLINAQKSYSDYLRSRGIVDTLSQVIEAIEDYSYSAEPQESLPLELSKEPVPTK